MKLARLVAEVRARATPHIGHIQADSINIALATLTGLGAMPTAEGHTIRTVLAALALSHSNPAFDMRDVELLTPLALVSLDRLLEGILVGELAERDLQSKLRPFLVRPVN